MSSKIAWEGGFPTTTPNKDSHSSPWLEGLSFTHIEGNVLDKRIDKAEVLSISTMSDGLLGSFAKIDV